MEGVWKVNIWLSKPFGCCSSCPDGEKCSDVCIACGTKTYIGDYTINQQGFIRNKKEYEVACEPRAGSWWRNITGEELCQLLKTERDAFQLIPDDKVCEYGNKSWKCNFIEQEYLNNRNLYDQFYKLNKDELLNQVKRIGELCKSQNGSWRTFGMGGPIELRFYCDFPYEDAGKPCNNSKQCEGECNMDYFYVMSKYPVEARSENYSYEEGHHFNCTDNCTGYCSSLLIRWCDWRFEVNDGIITGHNIGVFCD